MKYVLPLIVIALPLCCQARDFVVDQKHAAAADTNPGIAARPFKTIGAAMLKVQPGDTIFVGAGTYREEVAYPGKDWNDPSRRSTLAAMPAAHPIIDGADVITSKWTRLPGDHPIYATPRDVYTQMVFVDEARLRQIGVQGNPQRAEKAGPFSFKKKYDGKDLADLVAGSFFYDAPASALRLARRCSDPSKHVVEAAVRTMGVSLLGTWTLRASTSATSPTVSGRASRPSALAANSASSRIAASRRTASSPDRLGRGLPDPQQRPCRERSHELHQQPRLPHDLRGNELHHSGWRGDVLCLTQGNKWVCWRDCKWLRNWWHDEPACALWLDISDANALIAENRFDNCSCGIYFEISRWAVIANNVFRHCGRACWIYSSDALVAHNVFDSCGEGVIVTGDPRLCNENQSVDEQDSSALMAVRNNLIVDNLLIDCPGAFIGITEDTGYGAGKLVRLQRLRLDAARLSSVWHAYQLHERLEHPLRDAAHLAAGAPLRHALDGLRPGSRPRTPGRLALGRSHPRRGRRRSALRRPREGRLPLRCRQPAAQPRHRDPGGAQLRLRPRRRSPDRLARVAKTVVESAPDRRPRIPSSTSGRRSTSASSRCPPSTCW